MIRTRKPDQKKLCPRCGSPMMQRENNVRYCPVCHYTESSQKTVISIKIDETEVKKELPKIEIYQVSASGVNKVPKLDSKFSHLVADRNSNTIWIWKGVQSSPGDAYKASVESTRLKSSLKLYSASIVRVEEGEEPETFPKIGAELEAMEKDRLKKEEESLKQQEEVRKRKEEEALKRKEEAMRQNEKETRRLQEEEDRKRQLEAERKRKEEEELRLKEEEAHKLREEEDRKRQLEAERKRKEEEQRRLREEEDRKRKVEEERKLREEEDRRAREKPVSATELLEKPVMEVKPGPEVEEEGDISENPEMKEAVASLTLIRGVSKEIAIKLFKVNISTIMELSLSDPENLTASGISLDTLKQIIRNAKDLLGLD